MKRCRTTGKKSYRNEVTAAYAIGRIRSSARNDPADKIPIRYYWCDFCPWIHLTSQEKK